MHMAYKHCYAIVDQFCHQKRYVKPLPIVGHECHMGGASLINFSLIIQLVFQKHDELFPNNQHFLTICHINVQNNRQLRDNWRNLFGWSHQRVKISVVDMSPVRCQHFRRNFDYMVKTIWEPCRLDTKNKIPALGKWHILLLISGCILCYLIYSNPTILTVRWFTHVFRVWQVTCSALLLYISHTYVACEPNMMSWESVFHRRCEGEPFHCYFWCTDSKMTPFLLPWIFKRTLKMHFRCTQNPRFLYTNIFVNTNRCT